jgi:hypothetical protein
MWKALAQWKTPRLVKKGSRQLPQDPKTAYSAVGLLLLKSRAVLSFQSMNLSA